MGVLAQDDGAGFEILVVQRRQRRQLRQAGVHGADDVGGGGAGAAALQGAAQPQCFRRPAAKIAIVLLN